MFDIKRGSDTTNVYVQREMKAYNIYPLMYKLIYLNDLF